MSASPVRAEKAAASSTNETWILDMTEWTNAPAEAGPEARDWKQAMKRGARCRCPNCGEGRMFRSFLKATPACETCGEDLSRHRADDMPPYVTIMIVGHVVVPLMLLIETVALWSMGAQMALWSGVTLAMTFAIMQPVKGALIAYQWALRMHGFDPEGDIHAMPVITPAQAP
ncbi:MAG: DUF983 domain-containing protein [Proteobacteria bacterium]|nr:DUF983 domain-containing protein [Pseudomonadota bacterium]